MESGSGRRPAPRHHCPRGSLGARTLTSRADGAVYHLDQRRPLMPDAVIVSTARTPIGRAYRGAFNNTHGAVLGGHVIQHAVQRAGLEPGEVEDVIMGCALPEGATGQNIARQARSEEHTSELQSHHDLV